MSSYRSPSYRFCDKCGGRYNIISPGFVRCLCGIFPNEIISVSYDKAPTPLQVLQQFRIFNYLKLASDKPFDDKLFKQVAKLIPEIRCKIIGSGSISEAKDMLSSEEIVCNDNQIIIPNLICGEIISGLWEIRENSTSYLELEKGGLAFSFSLKDTNRFSKQIFVFQDLLLAADLLMEIYTRYGIFVPIVAHPKLKLLENVSWLPKREIILVVEELQPGELKHLLPLNPRIVTSNAYVKYEKSPYRLSGYYRESVPLSDLVNEYIGLSPKTGIVVSGNKWYYSPNGAVAANMDVRIHKIRKYKNKFYYTGEMTIEGKKKIRFTLTKNKAYEKLKKLAAAAGRNFYVAPRLENKILEIAAAKSIPSVEEVTKLGIHPKAKKIILPNLIISESGITKDCVVSHRKATGNNLHWVTNPDIPISRCYGEHRAAISQLTVLFSLGLASSFLFTRRKEGVALFFLFPSTNFIEHILSCCGVEMDPGPKYSEPWPAFVPNTEEIINGVRKPFLVTYGDYLDLAAVALNYRVLIVNTDTVFTPLIPETTLQNAFCRILHAILVTSKQAGWMKDRSSDITMAHAIKNSIRIPDRVFNKITQRIFRIPRDRHIKATALLVGRLLNASMLSRSVLKPEQDGKYSISVKEINEALKEVPMSPFFFSPDGEDNIVLPRHMIRYGTSSPNALFSRFNTRPRAERN